MKAKLALLTALAVASSPVLAQEYDDYARVRSVTPEYEQVNTPREVCRSEYIPGPTRTAERSYAGPLLGGIAGALIGAQVGKGNGNKAATAAGAIAGTLVGSNLSNGWAAASSGPQEVRRCRVTDRWETRVTGYRVVYEYAGRTYSAVLPYDPGSRLRVRVVVEPAGGDGGYPNRWDD